MSIDPYTEEVKVENLVKRPIMVKIGEITNFQLVLSLVNPVNRDVELLGL